MEHAHPCTVTIHLDVSTYEILSRLANSTLRAPQAIGPQTTWDYLPRYIREICEVWAVDHRCAVNHPPEKETL